MRRLPVFVLLLLGSVDVHAAARMGPIAGERVVVRLVGQSSHIDGPASKSGDASMDLRLGERGTAYYVADGRLCGNAVGTPGDLAALRREHEHVWWIDARVAEATSERIRVDLDWSRYDAGDQVRGDHRTLTLGEGERHMLDFLDAPPGGCVRNLLVEVQVALAEDQQLAARRIHYDLWFVDRLAGGTASETRHAERQAGQGESCELTFEPLRWSVPGARFADGSTAEVEAEIVARVRGRVRADGTIDLDLNAGRFVGVAPAGRPRGGGTGAGGGRSVNVQPGETIELVLPEPQGSHTQLNDGASSSNAVTTVPSRRANADDHGVTAADGAIRVDFQPFFKDHTMSLLVTATVE